MAVRLIDTHCHLNFPPLRQNIATLIEQAHSNGVVGFVVPATNSSDWKELLGLSEKYPEIMHVALGVHPCFISQESLSNDLLSDQLQALSKHFIAIGECGLDARFDNLEQQLNIFEMQLELAGKLDKPVIMHSVRRHQEVLDLVKKCGLHWGVVHAFSGSYEQAKQFVDQGLHLGVGGVIKRNKGKTYDAFKRMPVDALLIETDSPDMYLPGNPERQGSPLDILEILSELSEMKQLDKESLADALQNNCQKLFFSSR
ncbi:MAG: TatD family hydrolase [Oleiphilaceae bacterium]|uniref:TatD family hydrolase n=1 Tax=Oleiphilus sp. HI0125 TaxID=1822266 RepID=UPI0007C3BA52|nr:TatD family hydrolase [Oleiphilus sp. HI0125]KZZ62577.1 hypothetical protein A3762_13305 [Oleiphilus sp. HI0125]MCH2159598.1 TatD family hydrolase [Oleiphilaceae bacterium]